MNDTTDGYLPPDWSDAEVMRTRRTPEQEEKKRERNRQYMREYMMRRRRKQGVLPNGAKKRIERHEPPDVPRGHPEFAKQYMRYYRTMKRKKGLR